MLTLKVQDFLFHDNKLFKISISIFYSSFRFNLYVAPRYASQAKTGKQKLLLV